MAWLEFPGEAEWGVAYDQSLVESERGELLIVVGIDRDMFALHPAQLVRPPVADMLRQVQEGGARVKLARIPRRPDGPLQ